MAFFLKRDKRQSDLVPTQTFCVGENVYEYIINRKSRRKTQIAIFVLPDGAIRVDAPPSSSIKFIKNAVEQRALWIQKKVIAAKKLINL